MSLHVGISGWLLGTASGANSRLLAVVRHAAALMRDDEHITVLHPETFEAPAAARSTGTAGKVTWLPVRIPTGSTLRRALSEGMHLPGLVREHAFDVFDHALLPVPRLPCPIVWTVHDLRITDGHGRHPGWLARMAVRQACRRARTIVVPSEFTAARLRAVVPSVAVEVIPNGVELPPVPGERLEPADYVLHVGHLEARKNLDVLVRAIASMPPRARPLLTLVGADAGAGEHLRSLADRLDVDDRVHIPGTVNDADLHDLYATARAVVVPSHYEGFGLCPLEALAHGRPVLISDRGALAEVVGRFGTVLPADDPEAWARAITDLGDDDDAARAARREHAATFSWRRTAERMLGCWRAAAQG